MSEGNISCGAWLEVSILMKISLVTNTHCEGELYICIEVKPSIDLFIYHPDQLNLLCLKYHVQFDQYSHSNDVKKQRIPQINMRH